MPARSVSIGYWTPITPVDAISSSSGAQPTSFAARSRTSRAFASPCSPVATFAFFDSVTTPRKREASSERFSSTLGPANRDCV